MSGHGIIPTPSSSLTPSPTFAMAHSNNPVVQSNSSNIAFDARVLHHQPQVRIGGFRGEIPAQLNFDAPREQEAQVPTHGHVGDVEEPQGGAGEGSSRGNGNEGNGDGQAPPPTNIRDMLRLGIVEMPDMTRPRQGRITLPVEKPKYY
ncbi:hypothetical protein CPC16_005269 [Podila verticillata]|nr:hypothetical protein BGZ52_004388 [Haplosporangium bisporale]KAF9214495.1 hypothetical protein BGZ59_003597 [Podila verticillata]KAF9390164.1 hypothetical protein CPC16_005269 [Podila verticillata]KFH67973.1 hypothetical protein MVEG_06704 [Podila verticillata NRRL 6337]